MPTYSVQVFNNSKTTWKFFVYQPPPVSYSNLTLAWLASRVQIPSGHTTQFVWQKSYQFVWSATQTVEPGVIIQARGQVYCDPQGANTTWFEFQNGTPALSDPVSGGAKGTLYINDAPNIPPHLYAVGIGMSLSPTFVESAEPNLPHMLIPLPDYYIAAIDEVEQGEVMDVKTITKTAEIPQFPTGVYNMTATFQADDTWSFTPFSVGQEAKVPQVDQVAKGAKVTQVK